MSNMLKRFAFIAPLAMFCAPAVAQTAEEVVKGVYVGAKDLCDQAKSQSLQSVIEAGNTILTNSGLESIEFNCAFLQMLKNPRMPAGWVVTSMCEEPGYAYPEMFSLVERTPGELELAAMSEARGEYSLPSDDGQDAPSGEEQPKAEALPAPPSPPSAPAQNEEANSDGSGEEAYGLSGVWYRCEGVAAP